MEARRWGVGGAVAGRKVAFPVDPEFEQKLVSGAYVQQPANPDSSED